MLKFLGNRNPYARFAALSLLACLAAIFLTDPLLAQPPTFDLPPRTIVDILAILDKETAGSSLLAQQNAVANSAVPKSGRPVVLFQSYLTRARARASLGRFRDAIRDAQLAIDSGKSELSTGDRLTARQLIVQQFMDAGEYSSARQLLSALERDADQQTTRGRLFSIYRYTITALVNLGDFARAEGYLRRLRALHTQSRSWPNNEIYASIREAEVERSQAVLASAKGQFRQAEIAFGRSAALVRETIRTLKNWPTAPVVTSAELEVRIDFEISMQGRERALQGRLAEGEADIRRSLLNRLREQGKYALPVANMIGRLGSVLLLQGRFAEAEDLLRVSLAIRRTIGVAADAETNVATLRQLSALATLRNRFDDANRIDAAIATLIQSWSPQRRNFYELDANKIFALLTTGQTVEGVAASQRLIEREVVRLGEGHPDLAIARGVFGIALARSGRDGEALIEFQKSIPTLLTTARMSDIDESAVVTLRNARIRDVIEGYIEVLARTPASAATDTVAEAFRLIDAVRGRSVQQAVTASAARIMASDRVLARLVREDQDHEKRIQAHYSLSNTILALPPGERDDGAVRQVNAEIEKLRSARKATQREITRRFPGYANLIDPQPPSIDDIRAALRPGEALVSLYFGTNQSFVWAVPKIGPISFAAIHETSATVERKIIELRKALEPNAETIADIPAFDLGVAHELYERLLKPVESGWRDAKSLIVVTNGALGLFPLGLLPTEPVRLAQGEALPFAAYRAVPWLARTHAITLVPSAAALKALRQLPAGSSTRETFIGFGDPYFNGTQAADAARSEAVSLVIANNDVTVSLRRRATPNTDRIDSADLAKLPRLPDTADELKAVARALGTDPQKVLHLGKAANEVTVKTADLSRYRIVAFATHGLLPGDLNGLMQPALALTAPNVAGVDGDGLLTTDEVLGLKLDADWVVLSACNTGAGSSAAAEALSGLGRAFFYAGTRSLLITNWSVDSTSARDLVTDLFQRLAADPTGARSEALRQAMMAILDGGGYVENGKLLYTYAHPIFWAPYSIIGETGAN